MRALICVAFAVLAVACGQTREVVPTSPSTLGDVIGESGGRASVRQAGIQCSDAPVVWVTKNFSPVGRSIHVVWQAATAVETYQVEVLHNRNGETPKFVYSFLTNRTNAYIDDKENGGRYYVRVRVKNPCDVFGAWSTTLIIYMDGGEAVSAPVIPPDEPPTDDPPTDEDDCDEDEDDGNNGHGNDCDHDDDSNPS